MQRIASGARAVLSLVTSVVLCAPVAPSRADYTYGGTEFSWEWLTDASRAIVLGEVTSLTDFGCELTIQRVLKRRELNVEPGQIVGLPVLGRSSARDFSDDVGAASLSGWPALLDQATYPADNEIRDVPWQPSFRKEETWSLHDRCLIFFSRDLGSPLQIINLNRPIRIEVDFLVLDMEGRVITKAEDLITRITTRVAATTDELGRPRVRGSGFTYFALDTPLEVDDDPSEYFLVVVPPDGRFNDRVTAIVQDARKPPITSTNRGFLKWERLQPLAVDYWFLGGRTATEFAADADKQRHAALRFMLQSCGHRIESHPEGVPDRCCSGEQYQAVVGDYRTYPHGWLCTLSPDGRHVAFLDRTVLQVYEVDAAQETVDRLVFTRRDIHRKRSSVAFSHDGRLFAYSTESNDVCLVDTAEWRPLWIGRFPMPKGQASEPRVSRTVCLKFSHDNRYLMQQSEAKDPRLSDDGDRWNTPLFGEMIHVWDVARGQVVFTPFEHWQKLLRFVTFHPRDSSRIRLQNTTGPLGDGIWSVTTGERITSLGKNDRWPDE